MSTNGIDIVNVKNINKDSENKKYLNIVKCNSVAIVNGTNKLSYLKNIKNSLDMINESASESNGIQKIDYSALGLFETSRKIAELCENI